MQLFIKRSGFASRYSEVVFQTFYSISHFLSVSPKELTNSKVERAASALTKAIERDKPPRRLFCALIAQKQSPLRFAPHC